MSIFNKFNVTEETVKNALDELIKKQFVEMIVDENGKEMYKITDLGLSYILREKKELN